MKKLYLIAGFLVASASTYAQQYRITTLAGTGVPGYSGDYGLAKDAQFTSPIRVAVDSQGNVYVTDKGNYAIHKIAPNGVITPVAGFGESGYSGDGGPAIQARISDTRDIAVDTAGNVFIADYVNAVVRRVDTNGIITTYAGKGNSRGYAGDGGQASQALLSFPAGLALDKAGNLYIADAGNYTVRKVATNGVITTVAGTGFSNFTAFPYENLPAKNAILGIPYSLATDAAGNLFIGDLGLGRLLRVDAAGLIHSVYTNFPAQNFAIDSAGNLYYPNYTNNTVAKILAGGTFLWISGIGVPGYSGDFGPGTGAQMNQPYGVAVSPNGTVYVAEQGSAVVRQLTPIPNSVGAVANAASILAFGIPSDAFGNAALPVSPGEIVAIFGAGIGPATLAVNPATIRGTTFSETTVTFNGIPAPIIYTSSTLVAAVVPYALAGATSADVTVTYKNLTATKLTVPVAAVAPGIFTSDSSGAGQAAAINVDDGTVNSASKPVVAGRFISLYATGEGLTSPAGVDGRPNPSVEPFARPIQAVNVTIDGNSAPVSFAGGAPTLVAGVLQVNVQVPSATRNGSSIPIQIQIGTAPAETRITTAGTLYAFGDTGLVSGCGNGKAVYTIIGATGIITGTGTAASTGGIVGSVFLSGGSGYAVGASCTTTITTGKGDGKLTLEISSLTGVASQIASIAVSK